jgi:cobalt/nickel transport system permease protein
MLIPHLLVAGVVEAGFTVAIYRFLCRVSLQSVPELPLSGRKSLWGILAVLIGLSPLGLLASGAAWGEWGADQITSVIQAGKSLGFLPAGMKAGFNFPAIIPDYSVKGLPEIAGYLVSALAGTAVLIILFKLASLLPGRKIREQPQQ